MRISENSQINVELYTTELRQRVETVWDQSTQFAELARLIEEIKAEAMNLHMFFLTKEEEEEQNSLLRLFDERVQGMVAATVSHMEKYRLFGWKELIYDGENEDEETKSTQ